MKAGAAERLHDEAAGRVYGPEAAEADGGERARLIGRLIGTGNRVLDVGCSYGLVLRYLQRMGNDVVGIDFAQTSIDQCRERGLEVYKADVENDALPTQLGTFDVVLCMETLEHLFDPLLVVKEKLVRALRPGGLLIVTVPNGAYLKDRLHLMVGRAPTFGSGIHLLPYRPYNLDHKTIFTVAGLKETFALSGFVVERLQPTPGYTPGLVLRTRTEWLWNVLARVRPTLFARDLLCVGRLPGETT